MNSYYYIQWCETRIERLTLDIIAAANPAAAAGEMVNASTSATAVADINEDCLRWLSAPAGTITSEGGTSVSMVQVVLIDQRYEVITRGWVEWYQERGQNWWRDGRWSVVMWQVRTESSPKKRSIIFGVLNLAVTIQEEKWPPQSNKNITRGRRA